MAVVVVTLLLSLLSLHLTWASVLPGLTSSPRTQASSPYQYSFSLGQSGGQQEINHQTEKPAEVKVCRYCSLCTCRQPSLQDGLRFSAWIRRYLYTPLYTNRDDTEEEEEEEEEETPQKKKKTNNSQRRKHKRRRLRLE